MTSSSANCDIDSCQLIRDPREQAELPLRSMELHHLAENIALGAMHGSRSNSAPDDDLIGLAKPIR